MPTLNCIHCRKQLGAHFELVRKAADGSTVNSVSLCGLVCCTQYAYDQAVQQGYKLVVGAQGLVAQLKNWLNG